MNAFFIRHKMVWGIFSSTLILVGLFSMATNLLRTGAIFNYGIDFTGGSSLTLSVGSVEKEFAKSRQVPEGLREETKTRIEAAVKASGTTHVQLTMAGRHYFLVRTSAMSTEQLDRVLACIHEKIPDATVIESDFIGAAIGSDLQKQAPWIIAVAIFLLLIYITFRFEFWAAIAAILALVHDTMITLGLTAILGLQVDGAFIAAILTILGYSINDTIVIFDRIRENARSMTDSFEAIAELSIWQTLTRSIYTVSTVLIVLAAIYFFGGASLKEFSLVLMIGIFFGGYSSIFIASPLLVMFKKWSD